MGQKCQSKTLWNYWSGNFLENLTNGFWKHFGHTASLYCVVNYSLKLRYRGYSSHRERVWGWGIFMMNFKINIKICTLITFYFFVTFMPLFGSFAVHFLYSSIYPLSLVNHLVIGYTRYALFIWESRVLWKLHYRCCHDFH